MDITCPLCSLVLKDPKGLLCNHAVCDDCLSRYIVNTFYIHNGHCGVSCPVCQTFNPIPNPNKPIAHWSEDFMLLENVANEINDLKLCTMASIPALRHNLNVFCHRYIQPVPLFSLSQVNQDYTFTSTWPKQQYRYLLHDRWRPSCQYLYKPRHRRTGLVSYQQSSTGSSLSLFTSVVPKVMHLIAETEIGAKAYSVGQDVYNMIMAKVTPSDDAVNQRENLPLGVLCDFSEPMGEDSVVQGNNSILSEMTSQKEGDHNAASEVNSGSVTGTSASPHAAVGHDVSQNETAMDAKTSDIISGFQLPSVKNSEQVTHHERTETKYVQKDGNNIQYITVQNYYTTHIHTNSYPEQNLTQNTTVNPSTNEVDPSPNANVLSTNQINPTENAMVPLSTNEKQVLKDNNKPDFLKGGLFKQPLQFPVWTNPLRNDIPESAWTTRNIVSKAYEFKDKFIQSMKEQVQHYKSMPSCKPGTKNENVSTRATGIENENVSKRAYSCYKNMQDRIKFGQNWRSHARRARKSTNFSRSLVEIDPNTSSMMSSVGLIKCDTNSAGRHHDNL